MTISAKTLIISSVVCLILGSAIGYFGKEEKVVEVEKIVEVEKVIEKIVDRVVEVAPKIKTTRIVKPDGTVVESRTEDGGKKTTVSTETKESVSEKTVEKVVEVINPKPLWSAGAGLHYEFDSVVHGRWTDFNPGFSGGYRLVGDLWIEGSVILKKDNFSSSLLGLGFRVEF